MVGRITALWLLGWSLVFTLLRRWTFRTRGFSVFRENYAADRIHLLGRDAQAELQSFAGCIACGRCNQGEALRIRQSSGEYPGLMPLVLNSLRSMRELEAAARAWRHIPDEVLGSKEPDCPARVPFRQMKRFVETQAAEFARTQGPGEASR